MQGIVEVLYSTHCFCDSASKSLQLHLKKKIIPMSDYLIFLWLIDWLEQANMVWKI